MSAALTAYLFAVLYMFVAMLSIALMIGCIVWRMYLIAFGCAVHIALCLFLCFSLMGI